MVQWSNHISHQLPNHATRDRKLTRSVESTYPKPLSAIAKIETDDDSMSNFEAMAACVLPCDPASNSKASAKIDRCNASELNALSIIGSRTRQNIDLCF